MRTLPHQDDPGENFRNLLPSLKFPQNRNKKNEEVGLIGKFNKMK